MAQHISVDAWFEARPAAIVPLPAAMFPDVAGRRVIYGRDGYWIRDLRATEIRDFGYGRPRVAVLPELDWHRAYISGGEARTVAMPVHRVWVEHRLQPVSEPGPSGDGGGDLADVEREARARLELIITIADPPPDRPAVAEDDLLSHPRLANPYGWFERLVSDRSTPPARIPVRALDSPNLTGRRMILNEISGFRYELRALGEPYLDEPTGAAMIDVTPERDYYAWLIDPNICPEVISHDASMFWVE